MIDEYLKMLTKKDATFYSSRLTCVNSKINVLFYVLLYLSDIGMQKVVQRKLFFFSRNYYHSNCSERALATENVR